jgi:hypothetical protein
LLENVEVQQGESRGRFEQLREPTHTMGLAKALHQGAFRAGDTQMSRLVRDIADGQFVEPLPPECLWRGQKQDLCRPDLDGRAGTLAMQGALLPDGVGGAEKLEGGMVGEHTVRSRGGTDEIPVGQEAACIDARRDGSVDPPSDTLDAAPAQMVFELVGGCAFIAGLAAGFRELAETEHRAVGKEGVEVEFTFYLHMGKYITRITIKRQLILHSPHVETTAC